MEKIFYLAQIFGGLSILGHIFLILSSIAILFSCLAISFDEDWYEEYPKKIFRIITPIFIVSLLLTIFVPSKRTFLLMMGGKAVDSIVEDKPKVKEIPGNTLDLLNEYIKAETEKIKSKNEN